MNKFRFTLITAAASVAAVGLADAASASPADAAVPQIIVHYDAHTFGTEAGTKAFYRRLVKAAEEVCAGQPSDSPFVSKAMSDCRKQAIDGALAQVHNTRLAEIASQSKRG